MTTNADVDAALAKLLEPLRAQAQQLDEQIAETTAELAKLRDARRRLTRIESAAAGSNGKPGPKKPRVGDASKVAVSPKLQQQTLDFLKEHAADFPEGFSASTIYKHDDYDLSGDAQIRNVLLHLRDRGLIRLDRLGAGGSKIYKVV